MSSSERQLPTPDACNSYLDSGFGEVQTPPVTREEQASVRACLAKGFRHFISQKLTSRTDSSGLVPIVEIVRADVPCRAFVADGKHEGNTLSEYVRQDLVASRVVTAKLKS
jgi:Tfp pilus assembly pilus retraction ATPase PilT